MTGMSGGLSFAIWLLFANLVNSALKDGLFRSAMILTEPLVACAL